MSSEEMEQRRKHLIRVCHPETSIHVCKNEVGPAAIESQGEHEEAAVEIVKQAVRLEKEGYQAVIPWCGGDPGLITCREAVRIPVVGAAARMAETCVRLGMSHSKGAYQFPKEK